MENLQLISFKRTIVGWVNFEDSLYKYNVDPITFRNITGASEQATLGTCELTTDELSLLIKQSKSIGLAPQT